MSALECSGEEVSKPPFEQRNDASEEEEPDSPSRSPDANTRAFSDGTSIEPVVDDVLDILAHSDLTHDSVLVPVDTSQLAQVGIHVLKGISQLECVNIAQSVLHVAVHAQF